MRISLLNLCLAVTAGAATFHAPGTVAADVLAFESRDRIGFQPANGESLTVPFRLEERGEVDLVLYTGDGDAIATFERRALEPGTHEWVWDGRDAEGRVVPDEAYHPVLTCECASGRVVVDPREKTGGVPLRGLNVQLSDDSTIAYRLPEPARVLIRVGIKGGAMARALDTWSPHAAGQVRQSWDGTGAGGENRVVDHPDLGVLVRAFSLPEHTIITTGNERSTYRAYRNEREWPRPVVDFEAVRFERDGNRLVREAQLPFSLLRDPAVSIEIIDGADSEEQGLPVVAGAATFRVDMPKDDRWLMQQSLYEVGFFLDYRFISEEETGYTPLSWRWAGDAEPGVHTMTVNISGLWGQVGVATLRFVVPKHEASSGP